MREYVDYTDWPNVPETPNTCKELTTTERRILIILLKKQLAHVMENEPDAYMSIASIKLLIDDNSV